MERKATENAGIASNDNSYINLTLIPTYIYIYIYIYTSVFLLDVFVF
jgi:hypothetical protein